MSKKTEKTTKTDNNSKENENITFLSTQEPSEMSKWYVVHTFSGNEYKVAKALKERVQLGGFTDRIFQVMVPRQKKIIVKDCKKRSVN